ncbi:MAG TPA: dienelactone hydrolase family protein [Dermatophilaceae bacterium]|nr:dienelactone hydrolase family protein [Dermatophilaceae bacterium]
MGECVPLDVPALSGGRPPGREHAAYLAVPDAPGPRPGVVVLHEAFGLDDVARRHTDRLARMGYLALAPDLFTRGSRASCLVSTFRALRSGRGEAFTDIAAARAALVADERCTGSVGVIGFCMGGGFALLLANRGYAVVSVNYGQPPADLEAALEGACPVVASYGGRDRGLRGAAARLEEALTAKGVPHDVVEYPTAGHSFLNDRDNAPWYLGPVSRFVLHAGPEPAAAAHAWGRIEAFLGAHLDAGAAEAETPGAGDVTPS